MQVALWILGIVIFFLAFLFFVGGYIVCVSSIKRNEKRNNPYWNKPLERWDEKKISEDDFALMQEGEQFLKSRLCEFVSITSRDGLKLSARVYENPAERGVFLLVHGYRSSSIGDFCGAVTTIYEMGYTLLMIDQRSHGRSEGKYIGFGAHERYDVVDWANWAKERWPGLPVVVDGLSMGAATVMMGCGVGYPDNVKAILADCGYTTPGAICRRTMKEGSKIPLFPMFYGAKMWVKLLAKYDLDGVSATDSLRCLADTTMYEKPLPVLLAHGRADDFVPYSMSEENMKAFEKDGKTADYAELFTSETAGHGLSFLKDKEGYLAALGRLLDKAGLPHDRVVDIADEALPDISGLTR